MNKLGTKFTYNSGYSATLSIFGCLEFLLFDFKLISSFYINKMHALSFAVNRRYFELQEHISFKSFSTEADKFLTCFGWHEANFFNSENECNKI